MVCSTAWLQTRMIQRYTRSQISMKKRNVRIIVMYQPYPVYLHSGTLHQYSIIDVKYNFYKHRRAIATNHDSSSQCICTQEDTGAELNIEGQHWISIGIFPNVCSGNSYIRCHCCKTSNTASKNVFIEFLIARQTADRMVSCSSPNF